MWPLKIDRVIIVIIVICVFFVFALRNLFYKEVGPAAEKERKKEKRHTTPQALKK